METPFKMFANQLEDHYPRMAAMYLFDQVLRILIPLAQVGIFPTDAAEITSTYAILVDKSAIENELLRYTSWMQTFAEQGAAHGFPLNDELILRFKGLASRSLEHITQTYSYVGWSEEELEQRSTLLNVLKTSVNTLFFHPIRLITYDGQPFKRLRDTCLALQSILEKLPDLKNMLPVVQLLVNQSNEFADAYAGIYIEINYEA